MVGRTPEYLGKKIESYDVKMSMLALLILAMDILAFSAWAIVSKWGTGAMNNSGPHGFSEILYAFTSGQGITAARSPASVQTRRGSIRPSASPC